MYPLSGIGVRLARAERFRLCDLALLSSVDLPLPLQSSLIAGRTRCNGPKGRHYRPLPGHQGWEVAASVIVAIHRGNAS